MPVFRLVRYTRQSAHFSHTQLYLKRIGLSFIYNAPQPAMRSHLFVRLVARHTHWILITTASNNNKNKKRLHVSLFLLYVHVLARPCVQENDGIDPMTTYASFCIISIYSRPFDGGGSWLAVNWVCFFSLSIYMNSDWNVVVCSTLIWRG